MTQTGKILKALKANKNGIENWKLAQITFKFNSRISDLRKEGYVITAVRQTLPNGRASNTYKYYLVEREKLNQDDRDVDGMKYEITPRRSLWERLKKGQL